MHLDIHEIRKIGTKFRILVWDSNSLCVQALFVLETCSFYVISVQIIESEIRSVMVNLDLTQPFPYRKLYSFKHRRLCNLKSGTTTSNPSPECIIAFLLSWVARTQLNHWTKRMVRIRLIMFVCCLFVCTAAPLRIRVVRSNRVAWKRPARRYFRNGPWTRK